MRKFILIILSAFLIFGCTKGQKADYKWTFENAESEHGMVASASPLASEIGIDILKNGGNAVDAAIGIMLALNVVEPNASGIGGGGFMMIKMNNVDRPVMIDYRETAPGAVDIDYYYDEKTDFRQVTSLGYRSICTPGALKGYDNALKKYGSKTLAEILGPVIELAENGFEISEKFGAMITDHYDTISLNEYTSALFCNEGIPKLPGETFTNKDLAETFRLIARNGVDEFYTGNLAQELSGEVRKNNGYLSVDDLKNFDVKIRTPLKGNYNGFEIYSPALPSAGGMQIIQMLNVLENFDLKKLGHNSPEYIHLLAEVFKQSFTDRYEYAGDPDFVDTPVNDIISKDYAKKISEKFTPGNAGKDNTPFGKKDESISTSHLSVIDSDGNIVAATQTINHFFGSGVAVPGRGFLLNDEMNDFDPNKISPNRIEPFKKPLSSMAPTIILKDGEPFLTIGTPGGTRIITALVQIIINLVDFEMSIDQAIEAPRVHAVRTRLYIEGSIEESTIETLKSFGHPIDVKGVKDLYFGGAQGIVRDPATGKLTGGADSRRDGFAIGH